MKLLSRRAERRHGCGLARRPDIMLFDAVPLFDAVTAALDPETVKEVLVAASS